VTGYRVSKLPDEDYNRKNLQVVLRMIAERVPDKRLAVVDEADKHNFPSFRLSCDIRIRFAITFYSGNYGRMKYGAVILIDWIYGRRWIGL
jgi:hypothetical protein